MLIHSEAQLNTIQLSRCYRQSSASGHSFAEPCFNPPSVSKYIQAPYGAHIQIETFGIITRTSTSARVWHIIDLIDSTMIHIQHILKHNIEIFLQLSSTHLVDKCVKVGIILWRYPRHVNTRAMSTWQEIKLALQSPLGTFG